MIAWAEGIPGRLVGIGDRSGRYEARKVDDSDGSSWDRWTLSGPRKGQPWTAGTLAEVQESAAFVDEWPGNSHTRPAMPA